MGQMPRKLVKHDSGYVCRCLWKRRAVEWVDGGKQNPPQCGASSSPEGSNRTNTEEGGPCSLCLGWTSNFPCPWISVLLFPRPLGLNWNYTSSCPRPQPADSWSTISRASLFRHILLACFPGEPWLIQQQVLSLVPRPPTCGQPGSLTWDSFSCQHSMRAL